MFLVNLKIVEVLQDIVTFLCCALKEGVDPSYDSSVSHYFHMLSYPDPRGPFVPPRYSHR